MPIVAGDIDFHLSGGSANVDPNAALGGAISSTELVNATPQNLFDIVSGQETTDGDTEYRCFYVKNNHGSLTLQGAKIWIETDTPSTDTDVEIGLGASAVNGIEAQVADESVAPSGITWESATGEPNALVIGDLPSGQHKAIWVKRVVSPGAGAYSLDNAVLKVSGDTAA